MLIDGASLTAVTSTVAEAPLLEKAEVPPRFEALPGPAMPATTLPAVPVAPSQA